MSSPPVPKDERRFSAAVEACRMDGRSKTVRAFGAKWVITAADAAWHAIALEPGAALPDHWWQSQAFLASDDWLITYRSGVRERLIRRVCAEGPTDISDIRAERLLQAEFAPASWWIGRTRASTGRRWMAHRRRSASTPDRLILAGSAEGLAALLRATPTSEVPAAREGATGGRGADPHTDGRSERTAA